jgi:hypothetical protein
MKRYFKWIPFVILIGVLVLPVWSQGTQHSITVAWTYAQGSDLATGFNVYRGIATGGPYTKLNASPLAITILSYADSTGTGGIKYFYVVTAVDAVGSESAPSPEASAIFLSNPAVPSAVTATAK